MRTQYEQCHLEKPALQRRCCLSWDLRGKKVSVDSVEGIPGTSEEKHRSVTDSELFESKACVSLSFVPQHLAVAWFSKCGFHQGTAI